MLRVRELALSESHYVSRLCKTTRDATVRTRAMIVLHSMQGFSPPKIARMVYWSPAWVRRVIRDFNRMGTTALYPNRAGVRPPKFTKPIRQKLVDLTCSPPICALPELVGGVRGGRRSAISIASFMLGSPPSSSFQTPRA